MKIENLKFKTTLLFAFLFRHVGVADWLFPEAHVLSSCYDPDRVASGNNVKVQKSFTVVETIDKAAAPIDVHGVQQQKRRSAIRNDDCSLLQKSKSQKRSFVFRHSVVRPRQSEVVCNKSLQTSDEGPFAIELALCRDVLPLMPLHRPTFRPRQHKRHDANHYDRQQAYDDALSHSSRLPQLPLNLHFAFSIPALRLSGSAVQLSTPNSQLSLTYAKTSKTPPRHDRATRHVHRRGR